MKKITLLFLSILTLTFIKGQSTACDSLTITGSQYQLQITANNLNTFIYYWETMGSDGTILEQDSSMSTTHNVYNFNMSTGQNYDTLVTCISTMNTFCCATLVWNGNNWIISSGSNPPPPPPLNCNANFYWWQNFDSTLNTFTTDIYCVENSTGGTGTGPIAYNWVFGDGNTSNLQYPTHVYNQVGDYNLCLTYTDANGCSSYYCDTITISSKSSGYTLHVIDESQINTLDILNSEPKNKSKIYPNPVNNLSFLDYSCDKNTNLSLTYFDYSGKIIKNENVKISSGNNKIELSTEELTNGLYFLKINGENHVETLSFIK